MIQCPACSDHVAEGKFCDSCGFRFDTGGSSALGGSGGRDLQKTMIVQAPGLPAAGSPVTPAWAVQPAAGSSPAFSPIGQGAPGLPPRPASAQGAPHPPVITPYQPSSAAGEPREAPRPPVFVPASTPTPAPQRVESHMHQDVVLDPGQRQLAPPSSPPPPAPIVPPAAPLAQPSPAPLPTPPQGANAGARPVSAKTIIVTDDLLRQAGLAPVPSGTARLVPKRFGALTNLEIPLEGTVRVGRFDPTSGPVDIDLSQFPGAEHVSRHHATVENTAGGWQVTDAGSANGVYVKANGQPNFSGRITSATTLRDGDEIAFGNVVMVFRNR